MDRNKFSIILEHIYNILLIALTVSMFIAVTYNVFMRFVINKSVGWADEISRFLFIWAAFIGSVIAYRNDEHVGLNFLVDKIKSRHLRHILSIIRQILIVILLAFLTWFGFRASTTVMNVSPALSIPMAIVYLIVPICGFFMVMIGIAKIYKLLTGVEESYNSRTSVE